MDTIHFCHKNNSSKLIFQILEKSQNTSGFHYLSLKYIVSNNNIFSVLAGPPQNKVDYAFQQNCDISCAKNDNKNGLET